jgi:hypothetical protein
MSELILKSKNINVADVKKLKDAWADFEAGLITEDKLQDVVTETQQKIVRTNLVNQRNTMRSSGKPEDRDTYLNAVGEEVTANADWMK